MAHDTTCVDVVTRRDHVFVNSLQGAWLPSVIAGETGIPLTERGAEFFCWCPDIRMNWRAESGRG